MSKAVFKKLKIINYNPIEKTKIKCSMCDNIIVKNGDMFVEKCHGCGAVQNFFSPTPYQELIMNTNNRVLLVAGGFGSGKTTADAKRIQQHVLSKPNMVVGCFAQTENQLMKEFKVKVLEKFFLKEWFIKQNKDHWVLKNGSTIDFYASDDPQKLRSASFTLILMVEASKDALYGLYYQLKTRLRHPNAITYKQDADGNYVFEDYYNKKIGRSQKRKVVEKDISQMIIESNPTDLWPKTHLLHKSKEIVYTESVRGIPDVKNNVTVGEEDIVTLISATTDNPTLSPQFIESVMADKEQWQINRDIFGDFSDSNRLIFGDILKNEVEPFSIPANWPRIMGADPGIKDPFAMLWIAIDPITRDIYFFDEYYKTGQTMLDVTQAIREIEKSNNTHQGNLIKRLIDPGAGARQHDARKFTSIQSILDEYGFKFELAKKSHDKKAEIVGIQALAKQNKIKFFNTLTNFKSELVKYAWLMSKDDTGFEEKVPTKNDHTIDTARYILTDLPQDLSTLKLNGFEQSGYLTPQGHAIFGEVKFKKKNKNIITIH